MQYRETDLDFVHRLMNEAGISYYFDHTGDKEELVLIDASSSHPKCATLDDKAIPVASPGAAGVLESISAFSHAAELRPTKFVLTDFDWVNPPVRLKGEAGGKDGKGKEREIYDGQAGFELVADSSAPDKDGKYDGPATAKIWQEAEKAREQAITASGDALGLQPGVDFNLSGCERNEFDQKYFVLAVKHHGTSQEGIIQNMAGSVEEPYRNDIECLPANVPYRPAQTLDKPRIMGAQTATVVGPAGEEVHTDAHGRIKVQFHWDRIGANDDKSSCWVRVAQIWAGAGFGALFLPRIGMEVVVQFLEGDPDLPLVVGCVYNGKNPTPIDLPNDKTKSGIVTVSSPQGTGHNELTFEDAKGKEMFHLQAEKNMETLVKNDDSHTVNHNRTAKVQGDQSTTVSGNNKLSVSGDNDTSIDGHCDTSVGPIYKQHIATGIRMESMIGAHLDTLLGARVTTVAGASAEVVAGAKAVAVGGIYADAVAGARVIAILGVKSEIIAGASSLAVAGAEMRTIGAALTETVGGAITRTAGGPLTETTGGAVTQTMAASRMATVTGADTLNALGGLSINAPGQSVSGFSDSVEFTTLSGVTLQTPLFSIKIGAEGITLDCGPSSIKLDATGIKIKGPMVSLEADTVLKAKGLMTNIN